MANRQRKSFLDLPAPVRRQIYLDAGCVRTCPIVITDERKRLVRVSHEGRSDCGPLYCRCPSLPRLLHVSRSINHEVASMIYGENRFMIYVDAWAAPEQSLGILQRFSSSTASRMRQLQILIKNAIGKAETKLPVVLDENSVHTPITKMLKELARCIRYWGNGSELSLYVILSNVEWRQQLGDHISALGPLQNCAVAWSGWGPAQPPSERKELEKAVRGAIKPPLIPHQFSRYADLPTELRHQILELAGLDFLSLWPWLPSQEVHVYGRSMKIVSTGGCCSKCTIPKGAGHPAKFLSCACGLSGYSSTCECSRFPGGLFKASKLLNEDATAVFFSKTRFYLHLYPYRSKEKTKNFWTDSLDFLRALSKPALYSIRMMDLAVDNDYHGVGKDLHVPESWIGLIDCIRNHCDLPLLYLSLYSPIRERESSISEEVALQRTATTRLVKAMKPLRGRVKRFHVFSNDSAAETAAERYIMGPDYKPWLDSKLHPNERSRYAPHKRDGTSYTGEWEISRDHDYDSD